MIGVRGEVADDPDGVQVVGETPGQLLRNQDLLDLVGHVLFVALVFSTRRFGRHRRLSAALA